MKQSKGEAQLRENVLRSLLDINAIGDPDQLLDYVDAVIAAVKKQDYFIHCGEILTVTWDNIVDSYREGTVNWSIQTEDWDSDDAWEDEDDDV